MQHAPTVTICELPQLAWLRLDGPDAAGFLQGQLSNDVHKLSAGQAQLSSYNSAKGRMLAVLHLIRDGDDILLELPRSLLTPTLARLKMFVLRSKLRLAADEQLAALGLIGAGAAPLLARLGLPEPQTALACARTADGLIVLRRLGTQPRYSILGPRERISALREQLGEVPADPEMRAWRLADIEAGVPLVLPETREHFVPQMANLDLLGGISLDKGCYTGQEIVARLHYLGQLKRRLFVARVEGPPPPPGSDVHVADEPQAVGEVVDAVACDAQGSLASIVLQLSQHESPLRIAGAATTVLSGPAVSGG